MMNSFELGKKLVALCTAGKNLEAIDSLYSPEIVSVEPMSMPGMPAEMTGMKAIREKNVWWLENHQVHSASVMGPYVNGDRFTVQFKFDVTQKQSGKRMNMEEVALYTTRNDKIVKEEFFYSPE